MHRFADDSADCCSDFEVGDDDAAWDGNCGGYDAKEELEVEWEEKFEIDWKMSILVVRKKFLIFILCLKNGPSKDPEFFCGI